MDCRKLNIALLSTVSVLLVFTILVLIKSLFAGSEGFEWGSVSDWCGSIANLLMAGAAIYTAWKANNWFTIKIKENALNQVTTFWTNCDAFSLDMLNAYSNVHRLNNTEPETESKNFAHLIFTQREDIDLLKIKLSALENQFQSLTFWNVSPKDETIFRNYFRTNCTALDTFKDAINFDVNDISERYEYNINFGRTLANTYRSLLKTHEALKKNMNNLFTLP
ncbi:hypothetical protein [Kluyvera sp. CRP]|uniref:hypothetical protein n=1 Tax=Kluyvera sp. CRP TaxID=2873269 RepID=UPI001CC20D62|nr:hypothetical protein [Kluyvera sp. CRP]UAK18530.1 hypothetical protein K7B04_14420 [Kluyvera sp. CRP]